jgi:hypothetical protein
MTALGSDSGTWWVANRPRERLGEQMSQQRRQQVQAIPSSRPARDGDT